MGKMYKVAVITRTKNRTLLLKRAIRSVHNQTMPDFVHVIINDGGDKKAVDRLVAKQEDRIKKNIRVIHNQASKGMEAASNEGIKSVDSVYVVIHDDDDSWHPDFLKKTTEYLESSGDEGVIAATDVIVERIVGDNVETIRAYRLRPEVHEINFYRQCLNNHALPIAFLYRRSVFGVIGYYDESLAVCGDWDFGLRFMLQFDIGFLEADKALAYYHHRPEAIGDEGNSIFAGSDQHRRVGNRLMNRYLREDIAKGKFGLGYMVNSMRHEREQEEWLLVKIAELDRKVNNLTRIFGVIESVRSDILGATPK